MYEMFSLIVFPSIISGCVTALLVIWLQNRSERDKIKRALLDELYLNDIGLQRVAKSLAENKLVITTFYTNAYREALSRGLFSEIPLELRIQMESLYQTLTYLNDMRRAQALGVYDIREKLKAAAISQIIPIIKYVRTKLRSEWKIKEKELSRTNTIKQKIRKFLKLAS